MQKWYWIILILLLSTSNIIIAQEYWGPTESICGIAGCTWSASNPCFDLYNRPCFEYNGPGYSDNYQLYFYDNSIQPLDGDSILLDGFSSHSPFITFDTQRLYFSSNRTGGFGGFDIWVSDWTGRAWGRPRNLGLPINSAADEYGASLPVDETALYFCRASRDEPWYQSSAIYKSEKIGGLWNEPIRLAEPLNSGLGDFEPAISANGLKLYFSSFRDTANQAALIYVSNYQGNNWSIPEPLNSNINHFQFCDFDTQMHCYSYSAAIDSAGSTMLITSYFICAMISGEILVSHLTDNFDNDLVVPSGFSISAYPNPFNAQTTISFTLPQAGVVKLAVYDIAGRLVERIADREFPSGNNRIIWDAKDKPSGIYFISAKSANLQSAGKLSLLK